MVTGKLDQVPVEVPCAWTPEKLRTRKIPAMKVEWAELILPLRCELKAEKLGPPHISLEYKTNDWQFSGKLMSF